MTTGGLPQNRDVWRIAAPMILSNITVPLLGMVDTGVTGHLDSPAYLGAVAIGGTIFGFLYMGLNFLRLGTCGISAQRYGAKDYDGLRVTLGQAIVVAILLAITLIALQVPIGNLSFYLIGADPVTTSYALEYFSIRIWSAPATLATYVLLGWFIGLQNARVPLMIVVTVNSINIVLDLLFVLVLGMKVDGVALASVIAEYAGLLVGIGFVILTLREHPGHWVTATLVNVREYAAFLAVNGHLFVRTMALMFTFAFVTAQGARLGGLFLAANAILINIQFLTAFALDGFAHAAEAMVGKAIGEKRRDALQRAVKLTLRWSLIFAVGFFVLYIALGPVLIRLLTDLPEVRETALRYLPWLVVSPLVSVWSFLYDGVYVGATRAREMRDIMVFSTLIIFLPAWYFLQGLGNDGLWLAFTLFMASRGIGMHMMYRTRVLPSI